MIAVVVIFLAAEMFLLFIVLAMFFPQIIMVCALLYITVAQNSIAREEEVASTSAKLNLLTQSVNVMTFNVIVIGQKKFCLSAPAHIERVVVRHDHLIAFQGLNIFHVYCARTVNGKKVFARKLTDEIPVPGIEHEYFGFCM